jgi:hypothetical protein
VTGGAILYTVGAAVTFVVAAALAYVLGPEVEGRESIPERSGFATVVGLAAAVIWFLLVPFVLLWGLVMSVAKLVLLFKKEGWPW